MSNVEGYEWVTYGLTLWSIMFLSILSAGNKLRNKLKDKTELVKKICLAVFVVTSMYWIITIPHVGSFYSFPDKSDYPSNITVEKQSDYIVENHKRIESLERQLERTREQLEAFTGRIKLILEFVMYVLIFFGANWIFSSNKKDSEENREDSRLDL